MTLQAIRIVEAAEREAQEQPVAMTPAIRLALGWLLFDRAAECWQAQAFTLALGSEPDLSYVVQADYCRRGGS